MTETDISGKIRLEISKLGGRLFRFPVGLYYTKNGSRIKIGTPGISDLIGWRSLKITQEMVGKTIAQFLAVEAKRPGGKTKKSRAIDQLNFIVTVNRSGGIAFKAYSHEEFLKYIKLLAL